jgi:uncharacterized repeat protein (TIGR01451 family)
MFTSSFRPSAVLSTLTLAVLITSTAVSASAQTYLVLYSFPGDTHRGRDPQAQLLLDSQGDLQGTTFQGGPGCDLSVGCGVVFRLDSARRQSILHTFNAQAKGTNPGSSMVRDKAGNFYGTSTYGGDFADGCDKIGCGTVFKLSPNGSMTVLHRFLAGANGAWPFGLTGDAAGNLYGVTSAGGIGCPDGQPSGCGVLFKIDAAGKFSVLHRFAGGQDGEFPNGPLALDSAGNIYGTTYQGGNTNDGICFAGCGLIFKVDQIGRKTTLFKFHGASDGANPMGGLLRDAAGNLYGTTFYGGNITCPDGCGMVFKLTASGTETTLYSFTGGYDGAMPNGDLIIDAAGTLYGTTRSGGVGCDRYGDSCGVVFKLDKSGRQTTLHMFEDQRDGGYPVSGLTRDAAGNLYGTTTEGGLPSDATCGTGCGVIFKITPVDSLDLTAIPYPTPPTPGSLLTYAFKVDNQNTIAAAHEVLSTHVPSGTTFYSVSLSGTPGVSACNTPQVGATGAVVCKENSVMRPGSTWTVRLTVQVNAPSGTVITETATASADNLAGSSVTLHHGVH